VKILVPALLAIAIVACKPLLPKPAARAKSPKPAKITQTVNPAQNTASVEQTPRASQKPSGNLRIGDDILNLPDDNDLRSAPTTPQDGKPTIIAKPPEE